MQESENTEPTAGIDDLRELLDTDSGESPELESAGADGESDGSQKNDAPTRFNDLAERLDMDLDALYKLEVSQSDDGTPVTIENLKDQYGKQSDFDLRALEFEERRTEQEAQLLQAQNELRDLLASLPERAVQPEVLQKLSEKREAQVQLERQRTLQAIPEWSDATKRTADIEGMAEHLTQYGFPVNYLEQVNDHRMVKHIRDSWQREQRIRTALAKVKAGKPNPTPRSAPAATPPQKRPLAGIGKGNARNKLEALFSNLGD